MARISYSEALTAIQTAIADAGGELSHNDLLDALAAQNLQDAQPHVIGAARRGDLSRKVVAVAPGKSELRYMV